MQQPIQVSRATKFRQASKLESNIFLCRLFTGSVYNHAEAADIDSRTQRAFCYLCSCISIQNISFPDQHHAK